MQSVQTVRRFPTEVFAALVGSITMMAYSAVEDSGSLTTSETLCYVRIALSAVLVMNMALAVSITYEAGRIPAWLRWTLTIALGAGLTFFAHTISSAQWDVYRYAAAALAVHAAVALSASWNRTRRGFWEFNKTLFLRTLTGGVFTLVLGAGVTIALAALHTLFDIHVQSWAYGCTWSFLIGIFNTLFVLGGVPKASDAHNEEVWTYPRVLSVFTQFVLLPLVVLFLVILYAYGIKVLFFADLNGAVSGFILALSVVGVLAYLLVYPLRVDAEHAWIAWFARWFGRLMVPLSVMLWVAILVRVDAYGITEERYAVMALSVCLTFISVYLAIVRDPDIRIIPGVLGLACVVAFAGPVGITSVSYNSQTSRANKVLAAHNVLVNGRFDSTAMSKLPYEDAAVVSAVVAYLNDYSDSSRLKSWLTSIGVTDIPHLSTEEVTQYMHVPVAPSGYATLELDVDRTLSPRSLWVRNGSVQPFNMSNYLSSHDDDSIVFYDSGKWMITFPKGKEILWVVSDPSGNADTLSLKSALTPEFNSDGHDYAPGEYTQTAEFPHHSIRFSFDQLEADFQDSTWSSQRARGIMIVTQK